MKKIIIFLILIVIFNFNVKAASNTFYIDRKVENMYVTRSNDMQVHNGAIFEIKRSDGTLVYCINPFIIEIKNQVYQGYNYANSLFNITDDKLNMINLLSYYGYNYESHKDIKWYGITQYLIWEVVSKDIFFTDKYHGNKTELYTDEIYEIKQLINKYLTLPSISRDTYNLSINSKYIFDDINQVLNNYEIESSNIDSKIVNNKLIINTNSSGEYAIKFRRHNPIINSNTLFYLEDSQPLILPGQTKDVIFTLNINVDSGSITINKIDSENKSRREASLENAIYGLYNENDLITTIETNKDGIGYIKDIPYGDYYIKEIKASTGYELDEETYIVSINYINKDIFINSYESVIKGNLILNKYYKDNDKLNIELDSNFEIYDINNNLLNDYILTNGYIKDTLEYGNYKVVQIKGKENYDFVNTFNVFINETKDYEYNLIDNKIVQIVEVPNTSKTDYFIYISKIFIGLGLFLVLFYFVINKKTTQ